MGPIRGWVPYSGRVASEIDFKLVAQVVEDLPRLVRETRERRGLSVRRAAAEARVSSTNLIRYERGGDCQVGTVLALLRWLAG